MNYRHLLYAILLLAVFGCTSDTHSDDQQQSRDHYAWIALRPGSYEQLRTFVLNNGTRDASPHGCIRYDFPDDMNTLMVEAENDTVPITVWSRLAGVPKDTIPSYLTLIMYHINPNDSWTAPGVNDSKQELAIRPIVDGMLKEIDN